MEKNIVEGDGAPIGQIRTGKELEEQRMYLISRDSMPKISNGEDMGRLVEVLMALEIKSTKAFHC